MRRIQVTGLDDEFIGTVSDHADLDDVFVLTTDDGERIKVKGWMVTIERAE